MPVATALDQIEQEVRDLVGAIPARAKQEAWTSDQRWTAEVMGVVCEAGRRRGFETCAHGWHASVGHGEWLYDAVWLDIQDSYLVDIPLVLESEWHRDGKVIDDDFLKLLLARAAHRVMVFRQKTADDVRRVLDHLQEQIEHFRPTVAGDRYLLLGFDSATTFRFASRLVIA